MGRWFAAAMMISLTSLIGVADAQRVKLDPAMVTPDGEAGEVAALVDEQEATTSPAPAPVGAPATPWAVPSQHLKDGRTAAAIIDLGEPRYVSALWVYDTNGKGELVIEAGEPGAWTPAGSYDCGRYNAWASIPLAVQTRYVRLVRKDQGSNINEIAIYETTADQHAKAVAQREADATAAAEKAAAEAKLAAEREAGLAKARQEAANRPVVDLGPLFGQATLVDEVDVTAADPGHAFKQDPPEASEIQTLLGKPARVLRKTPGEAAYIAFRLGQYKLLKPGGHYVLEIEYPEDAPRSWIINNSGNESSLGFHTGAALGDAFRPKYVNNLNESLDVPLSGKHQKWRMYFNLHDRFSDVQYVRGETGNRNLTADDGFTVTVAQFSAENLPVSEGAAISGMRLYELPGPPPKAQYKLPPDELPRRHLFWREEMADLVLHGEKNGTPAGLNEPLDWYRFKANQMDFLGLNTFSKDLLEFGAVQHWDTTPHGGNDWAYFDAKHKDLWRQIVGLMGERGFDILPYYEYSGSKGKNGLGPQKRAKPLTRDDAYSHIKWIESSNADITDPETYEDFKKMLEITIVWQRDQADFVGAWLRPRGQMPMSFGDGARKRFAEEANGGKAVTREELQADKQLLARYKEWWHGKRQQFLVAMRDFLREKGVEDAIILYTTEPGEPGVGFKTNQPTFVASDTKPWEERFAASSDEREAKTRVLTVDDVVKDKLYLEALQAEALNWGGWELDHRNPPADPANYKDTDGILFSHAFNRMYTVASPETFDAFRAPAGLAILRHYSLNENMMFDKGDKQQKLGYFAADIERAGPYSMMGEALAMANGDPRFIGYLRGRVYTRGFPEYVRNFNTAFLSLPALPSTRLDDASSDDAVVVRSIKTDKHGTYLAVINTAMTDKENVTVTLPASGTLTDAATGEAIAASGGKVQMTLYPYQMRALHLK